MVIQIMGVGGRGGVGRGLSEGNCVVARRKRPGQNVIILAYFSVIELGAGGMLGWVGEEDDPFFSFIPPSPIVSHDICFEKVKHQLTAGLNQL